MSLGVLLYYLKKMSNINKKILFICSGALIAVLALVLWLYVPVIFQEGNPCPLISSIWQLNFSQKDIVKLKIDGDRYMTKSWNGQERIIEVMKNQGYEFIEQMGSGYFFKSKSGESIVVVHRHYSRYYSLWSFPDKLEALPHSSSF